MMMSIPFSDSYTINLYICDKCESVIKVAIYEDNAGLREVLAKVIRTNTDFELAGEFGHCLDVVKNTEAFHPDVIIMDIDMPGISGIEGIKELKKNNINVEVIVNTVFDDDDRVFEAIKAGATGYLLKKSSLASLLDAIRDVVNGGAPMSSSIARKVLLMTSDRQQQHRLYEKLTERELTVLTYLSKGLSYKMVAEEMTISIDTVRGYIKRIYEKLQVHSITEAVHKVFIEKS
jgi:DNA-binding NarL/FixJ family response regulator